MAINREWHRKHKMPTKAEPSKRITWHAKHQKQCGCRPAPKAIQDEIDRRNAESQAAKS
jgi:hypothetical protein